MNREKFKKEAFEWLKTIGYSLALAMLITIFALPTVVSGASMYPTLEDYDVLLLSKAIYKLHGPQRGDIVVFQHQPDAKNYIKRVIGIEGDIVEIKDGLVYVNGIQLEEDYLIEADIKSVDIKVQVTKGKYFVLGDNRNGSKDSRSVEVGLVDEETIIGKAYFRLFPISKIGMVD